MWKALAVTAALLVAILALTKLQSGHPGLDPGLQLSLEHNLAVMRQTLLQTLAQPELDCVAQRADRGTAETLYRVWIDQRRDLATPADQDDADADVARSIGACGGNSGALEAQAHRQGMELNQALARAMLRAGR